MSKRTSERDQAFLREYYDDFSVNYDQPRDRGYHKLVDDLECGIVERYASGKRVLEVGCGTGLLLSRVASFATLAQGVDLSPGMLSRARARGLDVREGSATELPFSNASFDVVYSFKVLAHVHDIRAALREMHRVLAPGGVAIAEFYNRYSLRFAARRLAELVGGRAIGAQHNENEVPTRWDSPALCEQYVPHGMRIVARHGVRILTPWAGALQTPLAPLLRQSEARLSDGALARFGGFYVLVMRKDK